MILAAVLLMTVLFQAMGKAKKAFCLSISRQGAVFIVMLAAGAADAINMDGGGSATLAWWDAEKRETVIPNRHGPRFLGYRPVAMNLGFYYE